MPGLHVYFCIYIYEYSGLKKKQFNLFYLFQVCGYRIKLHFDGYSDCYDFWVNADALDIHPVGWCEKTGHKLHPPKGFVTFCFIF